MLLTFVCIAPFLSTKAEIDPPLTTTSGGIIFTPSSDALAVVAAVAPVEGRVGRTADEVLPTLPPNPCYAKRCRRGGRRIVNVTTVDPEQLFTYLLTTTSGGTTTKSSDGCGKQRLYAYSTM